MNKKELSRLWQMSQTELTDAERRALEHELDLHPGQRDAYKEFHRLRRSVAASRQDQFAPFFAERVVARIRRENAEQPADLVFFTSLVQAFRKVALAGTAIAVLLLTCNLVQQQTSLELLPTATVSLEEAIVPAFSPSLEDIL